MTQDWKNGYYLRSLAFLILLLSVFPTAAGASTKTYNFTMENNTGLNFENNYYIIEVLELNSHAPKFVKVNLTVGGTSKNFNLYESEDPYLSSPFNIVNIRSSFITDASALIKIEFPDNWSNPKPYQIVKPVVPVGVPNIVLTKSVDKTNMNIGDVAEFKIKMENTGNATAYNVTLSELLPNGFSKAPGSRFPPEIPAELAAGASQEVVYALKSVESGTFKIEPATVNYGSKTGKSNSLTIAVAGITQEKSYLTTDISLDKKNATVGELIKATVKITNTGKANAKSIRVKGMPPLGMEVIEGNLIKDYESINPAGIEEYRFTLKATEAGNYTIHLITVYNDNEAGMPVDSETIAVIGNERNYLYILVPIIIIIVGIVLFTIKRHREYSY
ncbi:MAG: BatD family protein [Candidatus Methanoperedens sp.]|nr:BatD family protein [Candidatus Methanoperedens sp.]